MQQFEINNEIKNLDIESIKVNLTHYSYDKRNIKAIIKNKVDTESNEYISAYSSFKGEIFENIIYELLLKYSQSHPDITRFIRKGPHKIEDNRFKKSGLQIDNSLQIVYKSAYKDISEFDALFFTKDSVYFVEMSTSKKTVSLNKRLAKKYALLKVLFPSMYIKALIVLTEGTKGIKAFPDYCTIWITKDFDDDKLIKDILFNKIKKRNLVSVNHKKFIDTYKVNYYRFQYFPTLEWILRTVRKNRRFVVDLSFFKSKKLSLYFNIYTKLYIGFITTEEFKILCPEFDMEVRNDRIIVTIEKVNQTLYDVVYYAKLKNGKLKRIYLSEKETSIKDKDLEGFTNIETRFIHQVLDESYELKAKHIEQTRRNIPVFIKYKS